MIPSIAIAILTYAQPDWLDALLLTMRTFGPPDCPVRVFCDGPAFPEVERTHAHYRDVCEEYSVPLRFLPEWGCIQANAQQAFEHTPEEWVICLQDDNLLVPGFLNKVFFTIGAWHDHESLPGMFQPPFWHVTDLAESVYYPGLSWNLGWTKRETLTATNLRPWFVQDLGRLDRVPPNPGWRKKTETAEPCVYINAHGSGMIVRRKVWEMVGGFSPYTWRFDEELSGRCWFETPYSIFQFDGPPMVHGCPGVLNPRPQPYHTFAGDKGFVQATGKTTHEWGLLGREAMELAGGDGCPISRALPREKGLLR